MSHCPWVIWARVIEQEREASGATDQGTPAQKTTDNMSASSTGNISQSAGISPRVAAASLLNASSATRPHDKLAGSVTSVTGQATLVP